MRFTKTAFMLVFAVVAAAFLSACSSWQDGSDSGYSDSGGGYGGHH